MAATITYLGQAGLYLQLGSTKIIIDPYLSDSVGKLEPAKTRRVPADLSFFEIEPDILVFTHDHLDHYDEETAGRYLSQEKGFIVLAPGTCWQKARTHRGSHNYVLFNEGTQWTQGEVRVMAVPAVHSDPQAIGLVIEGEGVTLYITGDTLYSRKLLEQLPAKVDVICLPINGVGNNMNPVDAARLVKDCGAAVAIPLHVGLLDDLSAQDFPCPNKRILNIYEENSMEAFL